MNDHPTDHDPANGQPRHDWHDRFLDAALQELHGSKPPDLSARVVMALQEAPRGPLPRTTGTPSRAPRSAPWAVAAALLAAIGLGFVAAFAAFRLGGAGGLDDRFETFVVAVSGRVECRAAARGEGEGALQAVAEPAAGAVPFVAAKGNRLRCVEPSSFVLGTFGRLVAHADSALEVRAMELTRKHGVIAASSLTLVVVAGVVTWHSLTHSETARAGETLRMEAGGAGDARALAAENAELKRRIGELERAEASRAATLARSPAPTSPPPDPAPAEAPPAEAPPVATSSAVFTDEQFAALAKLDWAAMGSVTHEMGPMLADLVKQMEETGKVPTELAVKIGQLNGQLLSQLPQLLEAGLPGVGANGAYTHPLVSANILATTLQASGQPLDATQRAAIAGLVRSFGAENRSIADGTHEYELEELIAETEMKDRFYREVSTLLTPEQERTMYPEGSRGYDGVSLFSTSLMTRPFVEAVGSTGPADFARAASNRLGEELDLDEGTAGQVRGVVERMMAASPELWSAKGNKTEATLQMMKAGRVPAAMKKQLAVLREIERHVALTPEQRTKLRKLRGILVPLPK